MFYQTNRTQAAERAENAIFVPGDLDLWPLNSFKRGTKHVSGSWDIWPIIQKQKNTDWQRQNRTFRSSLRAVNVYYGQELNNILLFSIVH